jgi:hypothetical protein
VHALEQRQARRSGHEAIGPTGHEIRIMELVLGADYRFGHWDLD